MSAAQNPRWFRARSRLGIGRKFAPSAVAATMFLAIGTYGAFASPRHPDEDQAIWESQYLVHQLASGDFRGRADDLFTDPHWDPRAYWALGSYTSTRLIYGLALTVTPRTHATIRPYSYTDPSLQGPETRTDDLTLEVARLAGVLCAAMGIALLGLRFRWAAVCAAAVLLLLPGGLGTFSRAWAEGPLLLAFGLCSAAYGTRWFALALGAGVTFKLTVLGLWPLIVLRRARIMPLAYAAWAMLLTYVVLTPASWFSGKGPLYILDQVRFRLSQYSGQSTHGAFFPSRYFWPFELAAVLLAAELVKRVLVRRRQAYIAAQGSTVRGVGSAPRP